MTRPFTDMTVWRAALLAAVFVSSFLSSAQVRAEPPRVLATLLPIHSLTAQITDGITEPQLLVEGAGSPHGYQLRPSDARAMEQADLVVWVGPAMEGFLVRPLGSLSDASKQLTLMDLAGVERAAAVSHEAHGHGDQHGHDDHGHGHGDDHGHDHGHDHAGGDAHIWLSPDNARAILRGIASRLSELDPGNAGRYAGNLERALAALDVLDADLSQRLAPLAGRAFVVFHDAYGGLVQHYGLTQAGYVTVTPDRGLGAGHLQELRERMEQDAVVCLFSEPQFSRSMVESLAADLELRVGVLDPLGADLEPGPQAYGQLMRALGQSLSDCLAD